MADHAPEPWAMRRQGERWRVVAADGAIVAVVDFAVGDPARIEANAARIVAAVNACERIPTVALAGGVVNDLMGALTMLAMRPRSIRARRYATETLARTEGTTE